MARNRLGRRQYGLKAFLIFAVALGAGLPTVYRISEAVYRRFTEHAALDKLQRFWPKVTTRFGAVVEIKLYEQPGPETPRGIMKIGELDRFAPIRGVPPFGDDDLAAVASLTSLEVLNISWTNVTDNALQYLGGLHRLRELDLSGLKLTVEAVPHLSQLKSLKKLDLTRTALSEVDVERIRSALPTTIVRAEGSD